MGASLRYVASLLLLTLQALSARPAVALSAAGFMFANNLVFFVTWAIYFANFSALKGWRLEDVAALARRASANKPERLELFGLDQKAHELRSNTVG